MSALAIWHDAMPLRITSADQSWLRHLRRNATIGWTRDAQRAGMKQANNATAHSRTVTARNVSASVLVTPTSKLFKKRVRA